MAFPTTSVLDNFNRANENPLSGWVTFVSGDPHMKVVSNHAEGVGTWGGDAFGTDCATADQEVFATLAGVMTGGVSHAIYGRIQEAGTGTPDGYGVEYQPLVHTVQLMILTNNSTSGLASATSLTMASGDKLGLEMIGSTISGYYFQSGVWTQFASVTNTTYTTGRKIGVSANDPTTCWYDDFGGGDISAAPAFVKPVRAIVTGQSVTRAATRCVGELGKAKGRIYIPRLWTPREALGAC